MNDSSISFTDEEYEALANFARIAGYVNVKAAIFALFALKRKRDNSQTWRFCPSCGVEYTLLGSEAIDTGGLLQFVRSYYDAKIHLENKVLVTDGKKYYRVYYQTGSLLGEYYGEMKAVEAFTGTEETLYWLLYDSKLPYEVRSEGRILILQDDVYTVFSKGRFVMLKTRAEEDAVEVLKTGAIKG